MSRSEGSESTTPDGKVSAEGFSPFLTLTVDSFSELEDELKRFSSYRIVFIECYEELTGYNVVLELRPEAYQSDITDKLISAINFLADNIGFNR